MNFLSKKTSIIFLLLVIIITGQQITNAQTPFTCNELMYTVHGTNVGDAVSATTYPFSLYSSNGTTNPITFTKIQSTPITAVKVNAIGYNSKDNFIYAIQTDSPNYHLFRIDATGNFYKLGTLPAGVPAGFVGKQSVAGDFDSIGNYFFTIAGVQSNYIYWLRRTDTLTTNDITRPLVLDSLIVKDVSGTTITMPAPDFAYSTDGKFWGKASYGAPDITIISITLDTVTKIATVVKGATQLSATPLLGSMFASSDGNIYGFANNGAGLFRINKVTGDVIHIANTAVTMPGATPPNNKSIANVDGAHCLNGLITFNADLSITKDDGITTYTRGGTTTYTIVAKNNGPANVINAVVIDSIPAGITSMSYTATTSSGSTTKVVGTKTGAIIDTVSIPLDGTVTYTVTIDIPARYPTDLTNTARILMPADGTFIDPTPANNTATDIDAQPWVLPVSLKQFAGYLMNDVAHITWDVNNESVFSHYELERSNDGKTFTKIATINANNAEKYQYDDNVNELSGKAYYRLKLVDLSGDAEFSKTVSIVLANNIAIDQLWPNPVQDVLNIKFSAASQGIANIRLVDIYGSVVYEENKNMRQGTDIISIAGLSKFAKGIYTLNIIQNNKRIYHKVNLQ